MRFTERAEDDGTKDVADKKDRHRESELRLTCDRKGKGENVLSTSGQGGTQGGDENQRQADSD